MLASLLLLLGAPDASRLASPDYETREREEARCDSLLMALLLPRSHPDPEADARIRRLRQRNLRWVEGEYLERLAFRHDWKQWLDRWFLPNRSRIALRDVYDEIDANCGRCRELLGRWGIPTYHVDFQLRYAVDFWEFAGWCEFHRNIAPMPREVLP